MCSLFAHDLVLGIVAQDVQRITSLDEAVCRRAVYAVTDRFLAPDAFTQATEELLAGLRQGDMTRPIVIAFWDTVERVREARERGGPTQPLETSDERKGQCHADLQHVSRQRSLPDGVS